jgi:hypothetical protein
MSWVEGRSAMVVLKYEAAVDKYALQTVMRTDGTHGLWAPVPDSEKPEFIDQRGTVVIVLGRTPAEDTTVGPAGMPTPRRWILRYLNGRFFRFPEGADVRVHEGWQLEEGDRHRFMRRATGLAPWLAEPATTQVSGTVPVTGALVHWWILRPDADTNSGHYPTPGVAAALWQDELYGLEVHPRANTRLQSFGIATLNVPPGSGGHRSTEARYRNDTQGMRPTCSPPELEAVAQARGRAAVVRTRNHI